MTHAQKVNEYKRGNLARWINAVSVACKIVDEKYTIWCPCGGLATGLHTSHCSTYRHEVEKVAIKILEKEEKQRKEVENASK